MLRSKVAVAVVVGGVAVVVASCDVSATEHAVLTCAVVVSSISIIVVGIFILATSNFLFIADAIGIVVLQTVAAAIQMCFRRVGARVIAQHGFCHEVASILILASGDFIAVTDSI